MEEIEDSAIKFAIEQVGKLHDIPESTRDALISILKSKYAAGFLKALNDIDTP